MKKYPIVVGISGASGCIYGIKTLKLLAEMEFPTHLILSNAARYTLSIEYPSWEKEIADLPLVMHENEDIGAAPASGSFRTSGMLIAPCSIKTLSAVANSYNDNLMVRAADVTMKEKRPLVLMVRETPLHKGHLRLMMQATESGAIIAPPVPAFYHTPKSLNDIIHHTVFRALDIFGINHPKAQRWKENIN